jgi:hypothetical protein
LVFRIVQRSSFEGLRCLDHKEAGLVLAAERVIVETLGPSDKLLVNEKRRKNVRG